MPYDVDTLQIEIGASSENAAKQVRELADELKNLKSTMSGTWKNPIREMTGSGSQKSTSSKPQTADTSSKNNIEKTRTTLNGLRERIKIRIDSSDAKSATKNVGLLSKAFNGLKRVAFYRVIRSVIKEIGDAFKEGTENAYQYSAAMGGSIGYVAQSFDLLATKSFTMKNQLGAAFATLKAAIVPILIDIIAVVTRAAEAITRLFAILGGRSSYMRAVDTSKKWADSTAKGAKAAKEWRNQLMGFDEINRLEEPSSGGGGGGAAVPDYGQMFETVDIGDKIGGKLVEVFDVFKKAWQNEGQQTIDAIKREFESLKKLGASIGDSFFEVFTNGTGQTTLETILRIVQDISHASANLADNFRAAWEENEVGTAIIQNVWNILNDGLSVIERITKKARELTESIDFAPILKSVEGFTQSLGNTLSPIFDLIGNVFENAIMPFIAWAVEDGLPSLIDVLTSVSDIVGSILEPLVSEIDNLWGKLSPLFEWVGGAAVTILGYLQTAFEKVASVFASKGSKMSEALSKIGDVFSAVWKVVEPILNTMLELFGTVFSTIADIVGVNIGWIIDFISDLATILGGIIDFIGGVFSGDWSRAWDGILEIFDGIWSLIKDVIKVPLNVAISVLEGFINFCIDGLNLLLGTISDVANAVGSIVGISGVNLRISHVTIPRLETGGFPEDGLFFANHNELVGQFSNGKTAVANNEQIISGITAGVEEGNEGVIGVLYQILSVAQDISNNRGDGGFDLTELSREVTKHQAQMARANGI